MSTKQERVDRKNKAIQLLAEHKGTHEWLQEGMVDRVTRAYRPMTGCCKKCGIHYKLFKYNPTACPANTKTESDDG